MGGSSSESATRPTSSSKRTSRAQEAALTPVMRQVSQQVMEALTTGGVGARLPIAQQGVEATQAATSQATNQTQEDFARSGINPQDPFALETLGNMGLQGAQQAAMIPVDLARGLMELAPNFALGGTTPIITSQRASTAKGGEGGIKVLGGSGSSTANTGSSKGG